ncbi:MarC family protein [Bacillus sp. NP157]|nr:MarC family protein [Bacillus sp. NP157]
MSFDITFAIKVFTAMFAIMNPIANVPLFLSLTDGLTEANRRKVAWAVIFAVSIGCVVAAALGGAILAVFGVTVNDFRLAGGVMVFLIALDMLHGAPSSQHAPTVSEAEAMAEAEDVAVYPLSIPLLLGPGAIATLIVQGQTARNTNMALAFAVGLGAFLVVLAISLLGAPYVARYLSPKAVGIARRLMGMILAAIAVQMIVSGLRNAFPSLG